MKRKAIAAIVLLSIAISIGCGDRPDPGPPKDHVWVSIDVSKGLEGEFFWPDEDYPNYVNRRNVVYDKDLAEDLVHKRDENLVQVDIEETAHWRCGRNRALKGYVRGWNWWRVTDDSGEHGFMLFFDCGKPTRDRVDF